MPDVKFACPGCRLHIKVGVEYVGLTSSCPDCGAPFRIPAPPDEVKFACGGCRLRIALHRSYIGAQIQCPECATNLIVPDPAAPRSAPAPAPVPAKSARPATLQSPAPVPVPAQPAPAVSAVDAKPAVGPSKPQFDKPQFVKMEPPAGRKEPEVPDKDRSSAEAVAQGPVTRPPSVGAAPRFTLPPQAAPPPPSQSLTARPEPEVTCQKCGALLPEGTELCTGCGYNLKTGEMPAGEPAGPPPPPKKRRQLHMPPRAGKPKPKGSRWAAGVALAVCSLFFFRRLELLFFGRGQPDAADYVYVAFWGMMVASALGVLFRERK